MKFGVTIPNNWGIEDPQHVLALGPVAEELGYDSLWVMDHLFNNGYIRERLDDKPYYHPLATLSYLAATTRQVRLGTSVLVLPYHNPVELAKYTATLDHMSGGRVTLGVGVGAMTEEFAALGVPFRQRGALTNECITVMKELWTNPDPSYDSSRWHFSDLKFSPSPCKSRISRCGSVGPVQGLCAVPPPWVMAGIPLVCPPRSSAQGVRRCANWPARLDVTRMP